MSIKDIIRAWKDSSYRESLSEEQLAQLPSNPIGEVLSEEELLVINGGMRNTCWTDQNGVCSCDTDIYCVSDAARC